MICRGCHLLVADVLTVSFPSARWKVLQTQRGSITYCVRPTPGEQNDSPRSPSSACRLCTFLFEYCARTDTDERPFESRHSVFVRLGDPAKYQFFVTAENINHLICSNGLNQLHAKSLRIFEGSALRQGYGVLEAGANGKFLYPVHHRPLLPKIFDDDLESEQCFSGIRGWLEECRTLHISCGENESLLPKRVLDIGSAEADGMVYLYLPQPQTMAPYATVSYTWGPSGGSGRVKTKNHDPKHPDWSEKSRCAGTKVCEFPKTLQDAIYIARRLGFGYLWIDSVCIVQDDDQDWADQSAAMTQIYAGARLNISAASGEHSDWGMLRSSSSCTLRIGEIATVTGEEVEKSPTYKHSRRLYVSKTLDVLDLEEKFLSTRGWVFQERLVSPASLHYTNEGLLWECTHGIKIAHHQAFRREDWKAQWRRLLTLEAPLEIGHKHCHTADIYKDAALTAWKEWVAAYSERELYKYTDRLPAIAGVAKTLADRFGLTYAAGLWEEDLIGGLMWKRFNRTKALQRMQDDKTPSWSWASIQGKLEYIIKTLKSSPSNGPMLEIVDRVAVDEEKPGSFGQVSRGSMTVFGLLQEIVVDRTIHPGVRKRDWEEVGVKSGFVQPSNVLVMLDDYRISDAVLLPCWCLRLGTFNDEGRMSDVFLLLKRVERTRDHFTRIGLAETDAWSNVRSVTADSGRMYKYKPEQRSRLVLV